MIDQASDAISFRRPASEVDRPRGQRRIPMPATAGFAILAVLALTVTLAPLHRLVATEVPPLPDPPPVRVAEIATPPIPAEVEASIEAATARPMESSPVEP
jgi:hypothetical protein